MTVLELAHNFHNLMIAPELAEGFTIGKGKKLYWYIATTRYGRFKCYPLESTGELGWPRFVSPDQEVNVIAKP